MAHRDVEIVKELQAKVADLVKKLDGPRFRSTADEQRIIDFANCNVGKSERDSLVRDTAELFPTVPQIYRDIDQIRAGLEAFLGASGMKMKHLGSPTEDAAGMDINTVLRLATAIDRIRATDR